MNTEFSAVVNYLANLNDSGVDQALSDREDAVLAKKAKKVVHSVSE